MDEYGSFRHTKEDALEVATALREDPHEHTVVFAYSHDQVGSMLVTLSENFSVLGVMPFGGNPRGRMYVGIYGRGCGHLSLEKGPHHSYLEEKLNLEGEDGEKFAEFYSWIVEALNDAV